MATDANKFMFDVNNFDAGIGFDPDNPPAPTFSEEELNAARAAGFADGLKKGKADADASREQKVSEIVARLASDITTLLDAEAARAKRFETELLSLAHTLFTRAFPVLNDTYGENQIAQTITDILGNLGENSAVIIEVAPGDLEELSQSLRPLLGKHAGSVTILPQSDLTDGSFRMRWKDGGALRDTQQLAAQIADALARTLAQTHQTSHTDT